MHQIRNFQQAGAGVPRKLEIEAVIELVFDMWGDFGAVETAAEMGCLSGEDQDILDQIIEDNRLSVSWTEAEEAIIAECKRRMAAQAE